MCKSTSTTYACGYRSLIETQPCNYPKNCDQAKIHQKKSKETCGSCSTCIQHRNRIWIAIARSRIESQNPEREALEIDIVGRKRRIEKLKESRETRGTSASLESLIQAREDQIKAAQDSLFLLNEQRNTELWAMKLLENEILEAMRMEAAASGIDLSSVTLPQSPPPVCRPEPKTCWEALIEKFKNRFSVS